MPHDIAKRREITGKISLILGIVLFVLAALLLIYSVLAFAYYADVIAQAVANGQVSPNENGFEIMSVYMQNCVQYLIFSLLFFGVGWLLVSQFIKATPSTSTPKDSIPPFEEDQLDNGAETESESSSTHTSEDDVSQNSDDEDQ